MLKLTYESISNEQPIYSHVYQKHDRFLLNYYTRPVSNSTKEKREKLAGEMKEPQKVKAQITFIKTYLKKHI